MCTEWWKIKGGKRVHFGNSKSRGEKSILLLLLAPMPTLCPVAEWLEKRSQVKTKRCGHRLVVFHLASCPDCHFTVNVCNLFAFYFPQTLLETSCFLTLSWSWLGRCCREGPVGSVGSWTLPEAHRFGSLFAMKRVAAAGVGSQKFSCDRRLQEHKIFAN